jgi:hypothetical protein
MPFNFILEDEYQGYGDALLDEMMAENQREIERQTAEANAEIARAQQEAAEAASRVALMQQVIAIAKQPPGGEEPTVRAASLGDQPDNPYEAPYNLPDMSSLNIAPPADITPPAPEPALPPPQGGRGGPDIPQRETTPYAPDLPEGPPAPEPVRPAPSRYSPFDEIFARHTPDDLRDDDLFLRIVAATTKAESQWNPNAVGDGGASYGLFQMHSQGAGAGMTPAARMDPDIAASIMVPQLAANYRLVRAQNPNMPEVEIASLVAGMTERPLHWQNANSAARNNYRTAFRQVSGGAGAETAAYSGSARVSDPRDAVGYTGPPTADTGGAQPWQGDPLTLQISRSPLAEYQNRGGRWSNLSEQLAQATGLSDAQRARFASDLGLQYSRETGFTPPEMPPVQRAAGAFLNPGGFVAGEIERNTPWFAEASAARTFGPFNARDVLEAEANLIAPAPLYDAAGRVLAPFAREALQTARNVPGAVRSILPPFAPAPLYDAAGRVLAPFAREALQTARNVPGAVRSILPPFAREALQTARNVPDAVRSILPAADDARALILRRELGGGNLPPGGGPPVPPGRAEQILANLNWQQPHATPQGIRSRLNDLWTKAQQETLDRYVPLNQLGPELAQSVQLYLGRGGAAETRVRQALDPVLDALGRNNTGLQEAFDQFVQLQRDREVAVLAHSRGWDVGNRLSRSGIASPAEADAALTVLESRVGPEGWQRILQADGARQKAINLLLDD